MKELDPVLLSKVEEIYNWQFDNTGCFAHKLYSLIHKADPSNKARLRVAYPLEVKAYKLWHDAPNMMEFFAFHLPELVKDR